MLHTFLRALTLIPYVKAPQITSGLSIKSGLLRRYCDTARSMSSFEQNRSSPSAVTKKSILNVENVNMLGINAENVDEVISENA